MKKWSLSLIGIALIALIYYLLNSGIDTTKVNADNTVISNESKTGKINKDSIKNKIKSKKFSNTEKFNWLKGYDKATDNTPKVGLIQAFREFKKIKRCDKVIKSLNDNKEPYQEFMAYKNRRRTAENRIELSFIQRQYFDLWVESCQNLLEFDGELYTAAHERFRKRFYQTKAKTKIEKDFAKSWPYKVETEFIQFKYKYLINGYNADDKNLVKNQIIRIKGMLGYININEDIEFSTRSANEINMYETQLAELESIVDGSLLVDEDYLVNVYLEYDNNIETIDGFLQQNISSDAFLTLAPLMFYNKNKELGFYDSRYYQSMIKQVFQLYACSLDAPCDAESKIMNWECFLAPTANESACGKAIEEYFLGYYFSPNQLIDIDHTLSYLFEHYAKN